MRCTAPNHCNYLQRQPPAAPLHLQQFASCFDNTHRFQPDMDIRTLVPTRMPFLHGSTGDASWRQPTKCKQLASALRRCMQTSVSLAIKLQWCFDRGDRQACNVMPVDAPAVVESAYSVSSDTRLLRVSGSTNQRCFR